MNSKLIAAAKACGEAIERLLHKIEMNQSQLRLQINTAKTELEQLQKDMLDVIYHVLICLMIQ
ncbi:hypothetical protein [Candidatus Fukatsuia endosymbiont of Tuberolachnus salignus]|uniref:hypothetical protein n=1 Tax=Candidatus Fukatsuia endosymbiont of Tuberolachnus salignus TaxID=3077957 RepID=UPI00313CD0E1